jgi:hypothetical protein
MQSAADHIAAPGRVGIDILAGRGGPAEDVVEAGLLAGLDAEAKVGTGRRQAEGGQGEENHGSLHAEVED